VLVLPVSVPSPLSSYKWRNAWGFDLERLVWLNQHPAYPSGFYGFSFVLNAVLLMGIRQQSSVRLLWWCACDAT